MSREEELCSDPAAQQRATDMHRQYGEHDFGEFYLQAFDVMPPRRVLDIGCGTGELLRTFAPHIEWGLGIDLNPELVERARSDSEGIENLRFVAADVEQEGVPGLEEEVELVMANFVMPYIQDRRKFFQLVDEVLVDGGTLAIASLAVDDRAELRPLQLMATGGWEPETESPFYDHRERWLDDAVEVFGKGYVLCKFRNPLRFPTAEEFLAYYASTISYEQCQRKFPDMLERMQEVARAEWAARGGSLVVTRSIELVIL